MNSTRSEDKNQNQNESENKNQNQHESENKKENIDRRKILRAPWRTSINEDGTI
jgi:hypothetical protein